MDAVAESVQRAREAFACRDWPAAYKAFVQAQVRGQLNPADLVKLADAAWWLGRVDDSVAAGEQAYRHFLEAGLPRAAAMAALGVAVNLLGRGDDLQGEDWVGRSYGLLAHEPEGVEHGYLRFLAQVLAPLDTLGSADERACKELIGSARQVQELGSVHGEPTLVALGMLGEGRALVKAGQVAEGTALLDRVMAVLSADELLPEWAGELYCQLMAAANEVVDLRRLHRLAELTTRWLERLPAAAVFTGICAVHRSQLNQATGHWDRAELDASRASRDMVDIAPTVAAEAHYQVGEIRRLRGDAAGAEQAYRQAHRLGRDPQPGLALLRLAEGKVDTATIGIKAALLAAPRDRPVRARLRAAQVEIAAAGGVHDVMEAACAELEDIAATYATAGLNAMARHGRGLCLLATHRPDEALAVLRDACRQWQELKAPYACARVRLLLVRVYRQLGDEDAALLELDAAATAFGRLDAVPDLRACESLRGQRALPAGLTAREAEVLAHVARGRSNKGIAATLFISEKTVARHLSNIFAKLGVTSRTAAAAYAVEHGLTATEPAS